MPAPELLRTPRLPIPESAPVSRLPGERPAGSLRTILLALIVAAIPGVLSADSAISQEATAVGWSPHPDSRIAGYMLHYGTESGDYTETLDVGKVTKVSLQNLPSGRTYYCAVTAYFDPEFQSSFSNEICVTVPFKTPALSLRPRFDSSQGIQLDWDELEVPGVAGYRVYYQAPFEAQPTVIDLGPDTSVQLDDLPADTSFVAYITAYNSSGIESRPSHRVSFITPPLPPVITVTEDGPELQFEGTIGQSYDIYHSTDLVSWRMLTSIDNTDGTGRFVHRVDPETRPQSYYRLRSRGQTISAWMAVRGETDPLADADGDGINNLVTFATGADLRPKPSLARPKSGLADFPVAGVFATYPTFSYTLREGARDVVPIIEYSLDLKSWYNAWWSTVEVSNAPNGDGTRTVTLRERRPLEERGPNTRYYRIRFEMAGRRVQR